MSSRLASGRRGAEPFYWDVDRYYIVFPGNRIHLDFSGSSERHFHYLCTLVVAEQMPAGSSTFFVPFSRVVDRLRLLMHRQGLKNRVSAPALFDAWKHRLRPTSPYGRAIPKSCPYEVYASSELVPLPLRASERPEKGLASRIYERYLPDYRRLLGMRRDGPSVPMMVRHLPSR